VRIWNSIYEKEKFQNWCEKKIKGWEIESSWLGRGKHYAVEKFFHWKNFWRNQIKAIPKQWVKEKFVWKMSREIFKILKRNFLCLRSSKKFHFCQKEQMGRSGKWALKKNETGKAWLISQGDFEWFSWRKVDFF